MNNRVDVYVGSHVRMTREICGGTQSQLAASLQITPLLLRRYEMGIERFTAIHLVRIAKALRVNPGFFFDKFNRLDISSAVAETTPHGSIASGANDNSVDLNRGPSRCGTMSLTELKPATLVSATGLPDRHVTRAQQYSTKVDDYFRRHMVESPIPNGIGTASDRAN